MELSSETADKPKGYYEGLEDGIKGLVDQHRAEFDPPYRVGSTIGKWRMREFFLSRRDHRPGMPVLDISYEIYQVLVEDDDCVEALESLESLSKDQLNTVLHTLWPISESFAIELLENHVSLGDRSDVQCASLASTL